MWRAVGINVTGASHSESRSECQDAYRVFAGEDFVVAAVSDGLSSAPRSLEGASLAAGISVESVRRAREIGARQPFSCGVLAAAAILDARAAVLAMAVEEGVEPSAFASTLLVVVAAADGAVGWAQVGDGGIVAGIDGSDFSLMPRIESDFVNLTVPLTSARCEESIAFDDLEEPADLVAVFSDGLERAVLEREPGRPAPKPYGAFFSALRRNLARCRGTADESDLASAYRSWLEKEEFREKYGDDDVTLVVLARNEGEVLITVKDPA